MISFLSRLVVTCIFLYGPSSLCSQLNLSTGYFGAFETPSAINEILHEHNATRPDYSDSFSSIHYLHGIQIGLRYKAGKMAIEGRWLYGQKRRIASSADFRNKVNFILSGPGIELQQYIGPVVLSSSLEYINLITKPEFEEPDFAERSAVGAWNSRFSLGIYHAGEKGFSWALKPYFSVSWGNYALDTFAEALGLENTGSRSLSFEHFGLNVLLYNGPSR